jgi:hypothetical protein
MVEEDVVVDANRCSPLVVSWFDAAAHIASVTVDRPAVVDAADDLDDEGQGTAGRCRR